MTDTSIAYIHARRVWDSRGRPTVETDVLLEGGGVGRAIAPAGASTGSGEALDLRDGGSAFGGYDVTKAIDNVNTIIAHAVSGMDATDQETVDDRLIELDGPETRHASAPMLFYRFRWLPRTPRPRPPASRCIAILVALTRH